MERRRQVLVSEEVPIPRETVEGLLEATELALRAQFKVQRLLYTRGQKSLVVERRVPEDLLKKPNDFLTPYQMITQHADVSINDANLEPLHMLAQAVQSLTTEGYKLSMFVCENREVLRRWLGNDLRPEHIWQVPLLEDPDMHDNGLFVVGSTRGSLIQHIEAAVFCRIGD